MDIILKGGHVIDPANCVDEVRDIAISNGVFVDVTELAEKEGVETVDATGKVVAPGLVDIHVHLREPGMEYKEDIASGTEAAAAGGVTTMVAMPNTNPPIDSPENIALLQELIKEKAKVNVLISACLTKGRRGEEPADLAAMAETGAVAAFTDDGNCVPDPAVMEQIMATCAELDHVLVDHCEDRTVWNSGSMREGATADLLRATGMPKETETNIVARNIELSRKTGCAIHMQHISVRETVEMVRKAQEENLPVSAEVTPHHFTLTDEDLLCHGANAKMNPPLGTREDRQALLDGLIDGTIEVICTDHAPHAPHEKNKSVDDAIFGIIGLETLLPLSITELYHSGLMSLNDVLAKLTSCPAELLELDAGTLDYGRPADVVVFDPDQEYAIDIHSSKSKSRNSPFHGRIVKGKVFGTICGGNWVYREGI